MIRKFFLLTIVVLCFIGWTNKPALNTPVCTADSEQKRPQLVSDGEGGGVIVWEDARTGSDYDIYAQRLDASGHVLWPANGIAVCKAIGLQHFPQITADSAGGYIVTWYDRRNGKNYDIYAQRIDANGISKWTRDGVAICTAEADQYDPIPVSDGRGGAIIIWQDRRGGNDYDIYGQRIDANGRLQWDTNGNVICAEKHDQENPRPVPDGKGGVVVTWQDRRGGNNYDIYAQRIDARGVVQWTANGIEICTAPEDQKSPESVSDDTGGTVITWQDKRKGGDYDIYAQRIDISGTIQWTANGVAICTADNSQYDPRLASDGSGGAIIAWQDYRKGADCTFDAFAQQTDHKPEMCDIKHLNDWNIYVQYINSSGKIQWAANGISLCTSNVDQFKPQLISDGIGGAIITWRGADKENDQNIYAQALTPSGKVKWNAAGVAVSTAPGDQFDPLLTTDGRGGAIIAWYDKRKGNAFDIYAQSVCVSGEIGCPPPRENKVASNRQK